MSAGRQAGYANMSTAARAANLSAVPLMRAIKTMKLPLGWKFERGWDELQLINDETLAEGRATRKVMRGVGGRRR
jgi:hypothetical protein